MLQLILGPDRRILSKMLMEKISENAKNEISGQILIVPEQYSHETERVLCTFGGDTVSRYAEVLSFTRLASRTQSIYGGVCRTYLDNGGRLLTMYFAAKQVESRLKYYASARQKPAFLQQAGAMAEEFLTYGLQPQDLLNASKRLSGQFAQRLEELAILYESYLSVCKSGRQDPITRLQDLAETLVEEPFADGRQIFLDGFSDFTALQMQILEALLRRASCVTVALCTDGSSKSCFSAATETAKRLKKMALRLNVPTQTETCSDYAARSEAVDYFLRRAFLPKPESLANPAPAVRICHGQSIQELCEQAAMRVRRLARQGVRYRDIAIVAAGNSELTVLRRVFAQAGIAAYFAGGSQVCARPLPAAVLSALRAVERYEPEEVLAYLKSACSPLTLDACDRVEKYASMWQIRGSLWEKPWTMHPRGWGETWKDADKEALQQLNLWREAAIKPLTALRRGLESAACVQDMAKAVADFLEKTETAETLQQQAEALASSGQLQRAQETEQIYEVLISSLEQLSLVLGKTELQPATFTQLFEMLLNEAQIGTIPSTLDCVQVGSLADFRHKEAGYLLILGADDGKLPAISPTAGLLSETERQTLLSMGLSMAPAQEEKLEREFGWLYQTLLAATNGLEFYYSDEQPAFLVQKAQQLLPQCEKTAQPETFLPNLSYTAAWLLAEGKAVLSDTSPVLLQLMQDLKAKKTYGFSSLCQQTVEGLYGRKLSLSASKIDSFAACRYAFFLRYGLKAKPWKRAEFDAPQFGTFAHFVLEQTFREVKRLGGMQAIDDTALADLAKASIEEYTEKFVPDAADSRISYLLRRNTEEILSVVQDVGRELRKSDFAPCDMELKFGKNEALPPIEIRGKRGSGLLSGAVDRVDVYRTPSGGYYRVADYKTGQKDMDYAAILNGEGLQMFLYSAELEKYGAARYGASLKPAGVLYVPGRYPMEKIDLGGDENAAAKMHREQARRKGLVLEDEKILDAMEHTQDQFEYLPCKKKKDTVSGDTASSEQLQKLHEYVIRKVQDMTDGIFSGEVIPDPTIRGPQDSSCRFCDFRDACHKDLMAAQEHYIKKITAKRFWETVEGGSDNG